MCAEMVLACLLLTARTARTWAGVAEELRAVCVSKAVSSRTSAVLKEHTGPRRREAAGMLEPAPSLRTLASQKGPGDKACRLWGWTGSRAEWSGAGLR